MGIVWRKVKAFELILQEQHIISNLLLIKDMLLLNSNMGIVCIEVKVFELILQEQHIISNSPLIKTTVKLSIAMQSVSSPATLSIETWQMPFDI
jgi:hypothetical protein